MVDQVEIQGYIAYYNLVDWWLSSFSRDEREYLESKFQPMGIHGISINKGKDFETNQSVTNFLSGLSSWFNNKRDISIADRIHFKINEIAREKPVVEPGYFQGRHFSTYVSDIKSLKNNESYFELEGLLLNLVNATEAEGAYNNWGVAPYYYNELAIMYRKHKEYSKEVSILERYANQKHAPGAMPEKLKERLKKAKELLIS